MRGSFLSPRARTSESSDVELLIDSLASGSRTERLGLGCRPASGQIPAQKLIHMLDEEFWVLILRTVVCIGIENQRGVGQVLLAGDKNSPSAR